MKKYYDVVPDYSEMPGCCLVQIIHGWSDTVEFVDHDDYPTYPVLPTRTVLSIRAMKDWWTRKSVNLAALTDKQIELNGEVLKRHGFHAITCRMKNPTTGNYVTLFAKIGRQVHLAKGTKADNAFIAKFRKPSKPRKR